MGRNANSPIVGPSGAAFGRRSSRFLADFVGGGFDASSPGPVTQPGNGGGFSVSVPNPLGVSPVPATGSGGGFSAPPGSYAPQKADAGAGASSSPNAPDPITKYALIGLGALVILLGLYEVTR